MKVAGLAKCREMPNVWLLIFAFCAAFAPSKPYRAFAEEPPCAAYPECVRSRHFKTCEEATEGKPLLTMRITDVSRGRCLQSIVKFKPEDAAAHNLPEEIEMELGDGSCLIFNGKVGDTVQLALREELSVSTHRYSMACKPAVDRPGKSPTPTSR
jgi:hypothetical protein